MWKIKMVSKIFFQNLISIFARKFWQIKSNFLTQISNGTTIDVNNDTLTVKVTKKGN